MADLKEEKVGDHSGAKEGGMFSIDRSEFDRLQVSDGRACTSSPGLLQANSALQTTLQLQAAGQAEAEL